MSERGVLITTDISTKQLIVHIHEQAGRSIILQDLDDTHVLIREGCEARLREEIERLYDRNTYQRVS